jgi:hypothetical protein
VKKVYAGDMINLQKAFTKFYGSTLELKQDITQESMYAMDPSKGFVSYDKPWYDPNGKV